MDNRKAAKLIIKRAKKHPKLYSEPEIVYAKMIRKSMKQDEKESWLLFVFLDSSPIAV